MSKHSHRVNYWIIVAGLAGSGKTTFIQHAAERLVTRDELDMSIITDEEGDRVLRWLQRTGGALLNPEGAFTTDEERLFTRWARRIQVGEILIEPDLRVCLYDAPGTRDFDFLWKIMTPGTYLGAVTVIDSTAYHTVREAGRIAATFAAYADEPYIFAANKQDQPNALSSRDIQTLLKVADGHDAPVVPCVAHDPWSVKRTLIRLLELIRETYDDGIEG